MIGQDKMGVVADNEMIGDHSAMGFELRLFLQEGLGPEDDAVSDDTQLPRVKDARRNEMEDKFLAVEINSVTGIVSSLVAGDDVKRGRQQVHDLPFSLVAPLGPEHNNISHRNPS
jgi:hypothetical protein